VTGSRPRTVKGICTECVRAAEVPLAVRVKLPAKTVAGTDKFTVWLLPAATLNGETGDVVDPAGRPERVTITESAKPFWPVIDMAKAELEPPALAVTVEGSAAMLKSVEGSTVNARLAECRSAPDVPVTVGVKSPGDTVAGTDRTTV
jgi:hypothetical protein